MKQNEELIQKTAQALVTSSHAIALTGAGISTESGVRDFRGPQGIWTTDKDAEAKAYQRWDLFREDPKAYWEEVLGLTGSYGRFYKDLQDASPNAGHFALAELEAMGILKCVITQNVDGLHAKAGNTNVINYHGSVREYRCVACNNRFPFEEVSLKTLPPHCQCGKALKYDVVHFGEPIPPDVMHQAEDEARKSNMMLICGTSAVVYPFAALPLLL